MFEEILKLSQKSVQEIGGDTFNSSLANSNTAYTFKNVQQIEDKDIGLDILIDYRYHL